MQYALCEVPYEIKYHVPTDYAMPVDNCFDGFHCVSVFTNLRKIELKKGLHSIQVHTVVHHVPQRTTPVKGLSLTILALK